MAEETITAPVDAGASVAESTPVSAPETTSATPEVQATPEVPTFDASTFERLPDEDDRGYLRRSQEARAAAEKAKGEVKPEVKPEEVKPEVKDETKEQPKPEDPKPEQKTEAEDDLDEEPFSLEDRAPLPPKDLYAKLKENPDLDAKLTELGIKDALFQGQRMAAKAIGFMETFPGGVEDAKYAKEQAENFGTLDNDLTSIKTEGIVAVDRLMGRMLEMDYMVDDAGQPMLDAKGLPMQQGHVQAFVQHLGDLTWNTRLADAERQANETLKADPENEEANNTLAAIEVLKARSNKGSATEEEMSPQMKAKAAELKAREDELARAQERDSTAQHQQREDKIGVETDQKVNSEIESVLAKTDLPKEQWPLILSKIRDQAAERLSADKLFTSKRDWIMRAQYSPNVEKQRIAHSVNSTKATIFGDKGVLKAVLKEYGIKAVSKQQARREQIDTQIKAQRSDPKGTSSLAPAPKPLSNDEIWAKAKEAVRASGRDEDESKLVLRQVAEFRRQGF